MDFKRLLRGPYLYVLIALIGIAVGWSLISANGTTKITTQQGLQDLEQGKVASAQIFSNEQRVDLVLNDKTTAQFYYSTRAGPKWSRRSLTPS